jgi:hypothetical protein
LAALERGKFNPPASRNGKRNDLHPAQVSAPRLALDAGDGVGNNVALIALYISGIGLLVSIAGAVIAYRAKEQTRRHTEIIQRAYLSVEPGGIEEPYDRADRVHGYVICRNRGHLPARKLSWHTRTDTIQQGENNFRLAR